MLVGGRAVTVGSLVRLEAKLGKEDEVAQLLRDGLSLVLEEPFVGTAKILGVLAVLIPGTGRLKEWAYAGVIFDLTGALYSHLSSGDPVTVWVFAVIGLVLVGGSYVSGRLRTHERSVIQGDLVAA